jgi:hypothetical protein
VLQQIRTVPIGVLLFLAYGLLMLAFVGLTLPLVIREAVEAPVSFIGIVYMLLLAYLIFTLTLVLQRKQAGYPLAMGLATLGIALVLISPIGLPVTILAVVVVLALRRQASRDWFVEP